MELEIDHLPKPIKCILCGPETDAPIDGFGLRKVGQPALIFTHGAGGTITSDAVANFSHGFSSVLPILCFQGNINLKSRVGMFETIIEDRKFSTCLGGRSMGARAAVMAATKDTAQLVLVSYPLQNAKELRDQILLRLPSTTEVAFVVGGMDSMCDVEKLENVRSKMRCKTWRIVVEDADHGMNVKSKVGTRWIGQTVGELIARWLIGHDDRREGKISWNAEQEKAQWSGWMSAILSKAKTLPTSTKTPSKIPKRQQYLSDDESPPALENTSFNHEQSISMRTRKRTKI